MFEIGPEFNILSITNTLNLNQRKSLIFSEFSLEKFTAASITEIQ